jgi:hypothetical protein
LRAAINFAHSEGVLTRPVPGWLPDKPGSKDRWPTRAEAARLIDEARTARSDVRAYLPLFIVLGFNTGTTKGGGSSILETARVGASGRPARTPNWLASPRTRTTELYAHHHPDFQGEALEVLNRRNCG